MVVVVEVEVEVEVVVLNISGDLFIYIITSPWISGAM